MILLSKVVPSYVNTVTNTVYKVTWAYKYDTLQLKLQQFKLQQARFSTITILITRLRVCEEANRPVPAT